MNKLRKYSIERLGIERAVCTIENSPVFARNLFQRASEVLGVNLCGLEEDAIPAFDGSHNIGGSS